MTDGKEVAALIAEVQRGYRDFMLELDRVLPAGRPKAIAMTNAEQSMLWATHAVAVAAAEGRAQGEA